MPAFARAGTVRGTRGMLVAHLCVCLLFAYAVIHSPPAAAQTPYTVTHTTDTYSRFLTGTEHLPAAYGPFDRWDEGAAAISLPFDFVWFGTPYPTVYVYTNGFLSFSPPPGPGLLGPPAVVPRLEHPIHNYIGVLWGDLAGGPNPSIRSRVTGMPGERTVAIQVEGLVSSNNPSSEANFQVFLSEGSQQVDIRYGRNFGLSNLTAGIENATGSDGVNLMLPSPTCGAACACAPRTCLSTNFLPDKRITIRPPDRPELTANIQTPPGGRAGTSFLAQFSLRNLGLQAAGPFRSEVRWTMSETSTAASTLLQAIDLPGLAASTSTTIDAVLTVPPTAPLGTYFIAVVVDRDRAVVEAVEDNNVVYSGPFATGPDLVGTLEIDDPSPAPMTGPEQTLPVRFTLRSAGAPVRSPVDVAFFLSAPSAPSVALGTRRLTLPDGFMLAQTIDLAIPAGAPLSPPAYSVVAHIDPPNAVSEIDEDNNTTVSDRAVTVRGPDLRVFRVDAGAIGFRGRAYPVEVFAQNDGAAVARDFAVCVVLSTDTNISLADDRLLLQTSALTVAAQSRASLRLEPVIPSDVVGGTWYVGAIVDCTNAVIEGDEGNNAASRASPIVVRDIAPDFIPVAVNTASVASAGETIPLAVTVANLGSAPGATNVRVVLSLNPGVTSQDPVVFETSAPLVLAPPEEGTAVGWGRIASTLPSGRYFVGAIVDPTNAVDEVFESNNTRIEGPIDVRGSGLAIVTPEPPNALTGVPYGRRFDAVGGSGTYGWSFEWTDIAPEGLRFDAARATLSGVPVAADLGAFDFTVTATSGGLTAVRDYRLIVAPPAVPLTVVSSVLPPALAGESYSVQLVAVGGQPPYRWRSLGAVPLGVALTEQGLLGGEPQLVGPSLFDVEVTDSGGRSVVATLALNILNPAVQLSITIAALPDGVAGSTYLAEVRADGGTPPYRWSLEGTLPPGLVLSDDETAQITGTPTVAGSYPLIVQVRDSGGLLDRNAYLLEVIEEGALTIVTGQPDQPALPRGELDSPYLTLDGQPVVLQATPNSGVTWSIVSGGLPAGLRLTPAGVIEGTPTETGAFAFLVVAVDAANDVRRATFALVVDGSLPPAAPEDCSCRDALGGQSEGWWLLGIALWAGSRRRFGVC
ncbi:MAG: CARDB domain-containing protein [Myxococcota bacterium]